VAEAREAELREAAERATRQEAETAAQRARAEYAEAERNNYHVANVDLWKRVTTYEEMAPWERVKDAAWRVWRYYVVGPVKVKSKPPRPLPRITVVTPAYNAAETIRETIESVLAQGYPNLEYIVVDGGSTDGTMAIVEEYRPRLALVISEPDGGMYDAVAKGFDRSTGDVLGYLNADDMLEAGGLARIGAYFRDHRRHDVIYHEDTVQVGGWRFPNVAQPRVNTTRLVKGHILFQDGVWFRRRAYFWCGGLNRKLRLAGDYDLWMRMSRMFRMRRVDGHVSSFRTREGQLSADMTTYRAEQDVVRREFVSKRGWLGVVKARVEWAWDVFMERIVGRVFGRKRRLFFPIDFAQMPPPPGEAPPVPLNEPTCPLTGEKVDRLILSARDTRFGDRRINYLYYQSKSGLAVTYPPMTKEALNELYEKYYSQKVPEVIEPAAGYGSPYRHWRGTKRLARIFTYIRVVGKYLDRGNKGLLWLSDRTIDEVLRVIGSRVPRRGSRARFLDVGCFDGSLLNEIRKVTDWETFGLEPNEHAVALARSTGHQVWQAYADDAPFVVPQGMLFDVVYLGQTIEHLSNPLETIRRLKCLLAPGGILVMSTPNLDSAQIDRFGPTWAHWHLPYHRAIYSKRALREVAARTEMRVVSSKTFSHPYWTFMSILLNELGTGAAVPHGIEVPEMWRRRALALTFWAKAFWDWRGRGDYIYVVMKAD
jgi:glycosyltransferase involved in cell wall biosynthesis